MLEQFYKDCRNELIGWCTTLTHDPMLAEDLVHEAFLRAMEQYLATLESLSHGQKKAWFYRVIKNMYIDRIRHQRFESVSEELPGQGSNAPEYDDIDWEQLLDTLPGKEGVFFAMRYLEGYTSTEIGNFFHIPAGTVRAQLSSARKHLKAALKGDNYV